MWQQQHCGKVQEIKAINELGNRLHLTMQTIYFLKMSQLAALEEISHLTLLL
jgi:hypothetical protein